MMVDCASLRMNSSVHFSLQLHCKSKSRIVHRQFHTLEFQLKKLKREKGKEQIDSDIFHI